MELFLSVCRLKECRADGNNWSRYYLLGQNFLSSKKTDCRTCNFSIEPIGSSKCIRLESLCNVKYSAKKKLIPVGNDSWDSDVLYNCDHGFKCAEYLNSNVILCFGSLQSAESFAIVRNHKNVLKNQLHPLKGQPE